MRFRVFRGPANAPPPAPSSGEEGRTGAQEPPVEELGEDRIEGAGAPVAPVAPGIEGVRRPVAPVVVPRWIQLVLLPIGLLALWAVARAAGPVLLILLAASTSALILNPLLKMLQRRGIPRGLAILFVYLAFFAALGGLGVLLSDPLSTQVSRLERNVPGLTRQANRELSSFQRWLNRRGIKVQVEQQGQTALQTLEKDVVKSSGSVVSFSRNLLGQVVTTGFDLVLVLVLSVYLLVYAGEIGDLVRRVMPAGDGSPEDDFPLLVQRAVFGYVRGQLLFSLVMGASAAFTLSIFGLVGLFPDGSRYALFFGGFYGLMEFIPYIGPIIGPAPAVAVALFTDPLSALWVVLLFVALQQFEGHFVAPQVFRISLRINPILIILALLIGYQLYGIAGALLALPISAIVRQTVLYLRRHLVLEPWGTLPPGAGTLPMGSERCLDCGAPTARRDSFCRSCGASLEADVRAPR